MHYAQCNTWAHSIQFTNIDYMLQSSHLSICTHPLYMHPNCWLCFPAAPRELCIAVVFTTSQIIQYPDAAYVGIPCNLNGNRPPQIPNIATHIIMCCSNIDLPTACSTHIYMDFHIHLTRCGFVWACSVWTLHSWFVLSYGSHCICDQYNYTWAATVVVDLAIIHNTVFVMR